MSILDRQSLIKTLDNLNKAFFFGKPIPNNEKLKVAEFITGWQGKPGAYAGMFGLPTCDIDPKMLLFTGEPVTTRAAKAHIVGEEACRALILLDVKDTKVKEALDKATSNFLMRLAESETQKSYNGFYCCGTCTAAYWRHLAVGGLSEQQHRLTAGLSRLKNYRKGDGQWYRFPFYYTLLALTEINLPAAKVELSYTALVCEKTLGHIRVVEPYRSRRQFLLERALSKV